jgi:hypothetical protein
MSSIDSRDLTRSPAMKEDGLTQLSKHISPKNRNQSFFFS